ncbi:MAG: THUMP domain-containing protein [Thermoanaerobaculia bacterium]|nr:THUMP domain-containing protein [Thermoanaerobaculia bacterium]
MVLCSHGVEDLVASEAEEQGAEEVSLGPQGVVELQGDLAVAYRLCLWSRCASRVLMPLAEVPAESSDAFYPGVRSISWLDHLGPDDTLAVEARLRKARATNSHYVALKTKDAIVDRVRAETGRRPEVDLEDPRLRIHVFVEGDRATVSLDLSGEALHRRGYRGETGPAPLKETVAAAVLLRADWPAMANRGGAFLDPMCGSGTVVLEALMIAADMAPGLGRTRFGFEGWRGHDPDLWARIQDEARERRAAGLGGGLSPFVGSDRAADPLSAAEASARRLGVEEHLDLRERALSEASPPDQAPEGLVATNPPYGIRAGSEEEAEQTYRELGEVLRTRFGGWKAAVLAAEGSQLGSMELRAYKTNRLYNGPIQCLLGVYEIFA